MRSSDPTHDYRRRLHLAFAGASMALLAATVWMIRADHDRGWKNHQRTYRQRIEPWWAARTPETPDVDERGRPLSIEQIWLPELSIDYHFRDVARCDRCVTCHQAIAAAPSTDADPGAREPEKTLAVRLAPREEASAASSPQTNEQQFEKHFGLVLAPRGMLDPEAATIERVRARSPAAKAGLRRGDMLRAIDGRPVADRADAVARLVEVSSSPRAITLEFRRGAPQPYAAHPRLDLLVGPDSPHPAERFGCTICHDGQGSATEFRFASHTPDVPDQQRRWRREHGWFDNTDWEHPMPSRRLAESRCLKCHHDVVDLEPSDRFRDPPAAQLVAGYHLVRQNGCFGCHEILGTGPSGQSVGPDMRLEPDGAALGQAADAPPGTMRKVGPSLRNVARRLDAAFLARWLRQPADFRPATRMPRLFGLDEHLEGEELTRARRFEAVEIHAISQWLLQASPPIPLPAAPAGVTERPSPERGRRLFATVGCLACHRHPDFPEGQSVQGANLARLGEKYTSPQAAAWLTGWLRDPSGQWPRTMMPNLFLDVDPDSQGWRVPQRGEGRATRTDPVADLVAYLLAEGDSPIFATRKSGQSPELVERDLDALAVVYLSKTFSKREAKTFLRDGIPATKTDRVRGDAAELLGPISAEKKLRYVARRTIARRGCFGCHDIPGFETAQRIGPTLSAWGRKDASLLAFNQVDRLVDQEKPRSPDEAFYRDSLRSHRREGFLWQKLRSPRSFDFGATAGKAHDAQLTMGRFTMSPREREAVMTFVLGLVAQPPATPYVHQPTDRERAILEGRKVLAKYACAECHVLGMERWRVELAPDEFDVPAPADDFAFLRPRIWPARLAASRKTDLAGRVRAELIGMTQVDAEGKPVVLEGDEEDDQGRPRPIRAMMLWEPAVIAGQVLPPGGADPLIYEHQIARREPAEGGAFARLRYPQATAEARAAGVNMVGMEAWGWGPPPLVGEGRMVRPEWLYNFLLNPVPIRPAAVPRMPRFNLSPDEARRLVDYFAARDGAEYPYTGPASEARPVPPARLDGAMRIVLDRKTYCAKCHQVGDYHPDGETTATLGPDLANVGRRLRPEYVRRWLANPRAVRPYTPMPVNFPPTGPPLGQDLLEGSSLEQLDAVTELLRQYDAYLLNKTSVRAMMEKP